MKVLVTDANNRVALSVVRALGRAGFRIVAVEQRRFAGRTPAAFLSRHVVRREVLPNLEAGFVEAAAPLARDVDCVLPISTNVLIALASQRERFPSMPVPPIEVIRRANDKDSILAVAKRAGVPVPQSYTAESVRFPAVVKMRCDEGTYREPGERYRIVRTKDELRDAVAALSPVVIQEMIGGDGFGCGFLARDGELLASFCHRRDREYPVGGGPSALCESIREERLVAYTRALVRELGWTGVGMAEFRQDAKGDYRLLEINPRFWGSLPLAVRAGVNFPALLCRMALGEPIGPIRPYRTGIKVRFLTLDLPAAVQALRRPGWRRRYVGGFLRDLLDPRISDGVLDRADWRASVAYVLSRLT